MSLSDHATCRLCVIDQHSIINIVNLAHVLIKSTGQVKLQTQPHTRQMKWHKIGWAKFTALSGKQNITLIDFTDYIFKRSLQFKLVQAFFFVQVWITWETHVGTKPLASKRWICNDIFLHLNIYERTFARENWDSCVKKTYVAFDLFLLGNFSVLF